MSLVLVLMLVLPLLVLLLQGTIWGHLLLTVVRFMSRRVLLAVVVGCRCSCPVLARDDARDVHTFSNDLTNRSDHAVAGP